MKHLEKQTGLYYNILCRNMLTIGDDLMVENFTEKWVGIEDAATIGAYYNRLKDNHEGKLDCVDLLRINKEKGGDRKTHCDGMIQEVITLVEQILTEKGII